MVHVMYNCDYLKAVKTTRFYARVILRIVKQGKSIVEAIEEVAALPENQEDPETKALSNFHMTLWKKHLDKPVQESQHEHGLLCSKPEKQ